MLLPYPPCAEQHEIVAGLHSELDSLDALGVEAERAIELLTVTQPLSPPL
jgi:hypothetical protein